MAEITECPKCGKELAVARFYCHQCQDSYCGDCANNHKHIKKATVWIVTFKNDNGAIVGPEWKVPSKIKPTRWAKQAYPDRNYHIEIVNTGLTEDEYEEQEAS
jgi:hypothetical protein